MLSFCLIYSIIALIDLVLILSTAFHMCSGVLHIQNIATNMLDPKIKQKYQI